MDRPPTDAGSLKKALRRLKSGLLIALFLLVPFAGAFHPKLRKRRDPEEKEIGTGK
jgi:hypothetical protein